MTNEEIDTVLDDDRDEALSRGFTQHDTLTFMGKPLRPMTAGTLDLLQKTKNKVLLGLLDTPFSDLAGFALIHIADEKENKLVRANIWKGLRDGTSWNEYIYSFLNETPQVEAALQDAAPSFRQVIDDYVKVKTRSANPSDSKKNHGPPVG